MLVEGPAGIGKTALLRAARARAAALELDVLHARGTELEAEHPFGVVRRCLEPVVIGREDLFGGAARPAAPVLLEPASEDPPTSFGVLHGLFWLLATLAERRACALIVDDVQWVDEPSLRFLGFLARRVESVPVAVVLAARDDDAPPAELADIRTDPATTRVAPAPLGPEAVDAVLRAHVARDVEQAFSAACLHATAGNPFLLTQLVQALREQAVPPTAAGAARVAALAPREVTRHVRARLARLDEDARGLAYAIAILGDGAAPELAATLAELDAPSAADAADALLAAELLEPAAAADVRPASGALRFRHPLLRTAVADALSTRERDALHRTAAGLLRARGAPDEHVAAHVLAARPAGDPADVATLRAAARRAGARGAPDAAIPLLQRALDEPLDAAVRGAVLLELGLAERTAGRIEAGAEHLRAAARTAPDPLDRARAVGALVTVVQPYRAEYGTTLVPLIDRALADLDGADLELTITLEAMRLVVATVVDERRDPRAEEIAARLTALPGDTRTECAVLAQLADHRWRTGGTAAEVAALAERATRHAGALLEAGVDSAPVYFLLEALRGTDRLQTVERIAAHGVDVARRQGAARSMSAAFSHRALALSRLGQLADAEVDARTSAAIPQSDEIGRVMPQAFLALCLLEADRPAEAAAALDATGLGEEVPDVLPFTAVLAARMRVAHALGRPAAALADAEEHDRRLRFAAARGPVLGSALVAVEALDAVGREEEAGERLERAHRVAAAWGTPALRGQVLRVAARRAGDPERLAAAAELLAASPARVEHARALVDLGAALRRAGHRRDAREPLRAAHELARACGATVLRERARTELSATGVRVRRDALRGADALTPSERRIAEMAAAGASNAEIAQALFVTVKTVEMHLTNAYRKLAIAGRPELAAAL